jgi:agmatine deiminase
MTKNFSKVPADFGYVMPAEWTRHSAVWLAWPYDETTFPKRVEIAEKVMVEMIFHLHTSEHVNLLVLNEEMKQKAINFLKEKSVDLSKITFHITEFADVWTRDYGPTFLIQVRGEGEKNPAWIKWDYNAYGKADDPFFAPVLIDQDVFNKLHLEGKKFEPGIVMEGGAIEVNGAGTLLTTEQCLLNPNRNPHLNKEEIEQHLKDYLGVSKIIWLKNGLVNDHTDGHIDDIAKFVASDKILTAYENNPRDENYKILDDNYQTLKNATGAAGKPFEIIKMLMPHMNYEDGTKAPVSYINSYIGNSVVLVPIFNDPNDAQALEIFKSLFPDRKVVGIDCSEIIYGGGTIHCMTQQVPGFTKY